MNSYPNSSLHRSNLDYLRLLLALSVPFVHAWNLTGKPLPGLFPAVPGFLALSGFLVLQSLKGSRSIGHFFWKRFIRITPAFLFALLLTGLIFGQVAPTLKDWYTFGLSNSGNNKALWSLSCEEVLYGSLALLWLCGAYKRVALVWGLFILSVACTSILLPHIYTAELGRFSVIAVLPSAFLLGNIAYLHRDKLHGGYWSLASLVGLLVLFPFLPKNVVWMYWHQTALIGSMLWTGLAAPQIKWRIPLDISYGIYIYHMLMLGLLYRSGLHGRWPLLAADLSLTLPLSALSWYLLERPILKLKDMEFRWSYRIRGRLHSAPPQSAPLSPLA